MRHRLRYLPVSLALLLAACSTPQPLPAPATPDVVATAAPAEAPRVAPPPTMPIVKPAEPRPAAKPAQATVAPWSNEHEGAVLLDKLLPHGIPDRAGWHRDVMGAFTHLKLPYAPQYFCAVLAVAEQESGFDPDPVTPNLAAIVRGEIEKRRQKYLIPTIVVNAALAKTSPDGRSYSARIDALRTKREMNALFEDMVRELPFGQTIFEHKNPIRDGGPMQVSVAFAETQIRAWPYPYPYQNLRDEVFTRRGSVYFGTAILLQYPIRYSDMVYRFADYNVGRYASRNAAFQKAVAVLSHRKLALDGDLMLYQNKMERVISDQPSETLNALLPLADTLGMSRNDMVRDLKLDKYFGFGQTRLYQQVFALAEHAAGKPLPREAIPQIVLVSPKITHHLTTEWFARKVDGRYRSCLARGGFTP